MKKAKLCAVFLLLACAGAGLSGQESGQKKTEQKIEQGKEPFVVIFPVGYEGVWLGDQTVHAPAAGIGFMLGKQGIPFTQVERRFLGMVMYQSFFFTEDVQPDLPKQYHDVGALLDGRIERHQLLLIFRSASDAPVAGGFKTSQIGAGWGYEVIRRQHVSLILGAVLGVRDFSAIGVPFPVLPLPLIRFAIDTEWFASSFDFISGPNFGFTLAPKERIRLTGNIGIETLRTIADINCEFILWYRLFNADHRMGDFAGIGVGFKNQVTYFELSNRIQADTFELQKASVFATIDLSILTLQGGWVINSNYLIDGKNAGKNAGSGFFLSVQGTIPVIRQ